MTQIAKIAGVGVLTFAFSSIGLCQTDSVEDAVMERSNVPEEIVVYGRRNLVQLRYAVYAAEDNFFAAYNEVNTDDEFDVSCPKTFSIEAHRRLRTCKAKFLQDYERKFALGWNPNLAELRRKEKMLVEEMRKQIAERPELLDVFLELAKAKQAYDSEREGRRQ